MRKLLLASACNLILSSAINAQTTNPGKSIVGTWRVVEFADFDSVSKVWINRYGKNPRGYFTYTNSGIVNINISTDSPLKISSQEGKQFSPNLFDYIQTNSFGYFGTYSVGPEKGSVIHHVKGGTIPWYIDTDQPRVFQLKGDTLTIGDNKKTRRVLVRVD